jgi:hypothetical protein
MASYQHAQIANNNTVICYLLPVQGVRDEGRCLADDPVIGIYYKMRSKLMSDAARIPEFEENGQFCSGQKSG